MYFLVIHWNNVTIMKNCVYVTWINIWPFELEMPLQAWSSPRNDSTVTKALTPFHNLLTTSLQLLLFWSKFHLTQSMDWNMPNSRRTVPWVSFPLKLSFCLQPCVTRYSACSPCCIYHVCTRKATQMICNKFSWIHLCQGSSYTM